MTLTTLVAPLPNIDEAAGLHPLVKGELFQPREASEYNGYC